MSINLKSMCLNEAVTATSGTSRQLLYSATNGIAQVDQATVFNSHASTAYDFYYYVLTNTTLTGTVYQIDKVNVAAGATAVLTNLIGHKVPSSGSIQCYDGSGASLYVSISGMERQQ